MLLTVAHDFENYSRLQQLLVWSVASLDNLKFREITKPTNRTSANLCFTLCRTYCSKRDILLFCLLVPTSCSLHVQKTKLSKNVRETEGSIPMYCRSSQTMQMFSCTARKIVHSTKQMQQLENKTLTGSAPRNKNTNRAGEKQKGKKKKRRRGLLHICDVILRLQYERMQGFGTLQIPLSLL